MSEHVRDADMAVIRGLTRLHESNFSATRGELAALARAVDHLLERVDVLERRMHAYETFVGPTGPGVPGSILRLAESNQEQVDYYGLPICRNDQ